MESPLVIFAVHWDLEPPGGRSAGVLACEFTGRPRPVLLLAARRRRNSQPGRLRYEVHGKRAGKGWRQKIPHERFVGVLSDLHGPDNMTTNTIKSADVCNDCATLDAAKAKCSSAPEFLEQLIHRAERAGASDIHLQMAGPAAQIAFRLDGVMTPVSELPEDIAERVIGRIKFLARLKTYQDSLPQDGRIGRAEVDAQHDIRVATYPTVTGEKVVLRLFNQSVVKSLRELGLADEACAELERFLRRSSGLLLLTGPVGSGKTTTIYACLRHLAELGGRHVITVEDPAEQVLPGVMQTEVSEARGLTFARAARHLLRQDPQVLVIGEIRDEETAGITVRAALTGHLVISTLHAGSCKGVFERLLVMCRDHYAVWSAVALVLNQRLIRRLCGSCGGRGCAECFETGYHGRVPLVEWLRVGETLRRKLRAEGPDAVEPQRTLEAAASELLQRGLTDERERSRIFAHEMG